MAELLTAKEAEDLQVRPGIWLLPGPPPRAPEALESGRALDRLFEDVLAFEESFGAARRARGGRRAAGSAGGDGLL
jgi:hypothetical protein